MNTYVLLQLVKNRLVEVEAVRAKSFRDALIELDFGPYDAWEDYAAKMNECGLMTDDRFEKLCGLLDDSELKEEVADYAAEHWGTDGYYILEIKPDGSVTSRPEMSNRMEIM